MNQNQNSNSLLELKLNYSQEETMRTPFKPFFHYLSDKPDPNTTNLRNGGALYRLLRIFPLLSTRVKEKNH